MFHPPFDYLGGATTTRGRLMRLGTAARPRLLSVLIGLLALATAGDAAAGKHKYSVDDPVDCTGAVIGTQWKDVKKRDAVKDAPATVDLASSVMTDAVEADRFMTVKRACAEVAYRDKTFFLPALECIGEAAQSAADLGAARNDNHFDAYCAFDATARLAAKDASGAKGLQARAQEGRGTALVEMRRTNPDMADLYEDAAVRAYETAISLQPTADRQFALGRLYIKLGRAAKAEKAIEAGADLEGSGSKTALALVDLAEIKGEPAEKLRVLNRAKKAAPKSRSVNGALGLVHFDMGNLADARAAFLDVIADDAVDDAGKDSPAIRADAHYFLARLDARTANSYNEWQAVYDNARRAYDIIGGDTRYRQLLCLAHVARGGKTLRTEESAPFCEGQESPQGKLLYGVYLLRKAQYVPVRLLRNGRTSDSEREFRGYLSRAKDTFEAGVSNMGPRDKGTRVMWPGLTTEPDLKSTLDFGEDVVQWMSTFCRGDLEKTDKAAEVSVFERYNALDCKAR